MKDTLIILLREQGFSYPYVHAITSKLLEALSADRRPEHEVMNDLKDIGKALSMLNTTECPNCKQHSYDNSSCSSCGFDASETDIY